MGRIIFYLIRNVTTRLFGSLPIFIISSHNVCTPEILIKAKGFKIIFFNTHITTQLSHLKHCSQCILFKRILLHFTSLI
ncbi:hypothetical protein HanPI659440_Chr15g0613011 [Helianthus annuus]|nr:hypothetical protein HanPI659440_Chr15g0613011 [Helianthus annuus]